MSWFDCLITFKSLKQYVLQQIYLLFLDWITSAIAKLFPSSVIFIIQSSKLKKLQPGWIFMSSMDTSSISNCWGTLARSVKKDWMTGCMRHNCTISHPYFHTIPLIIYQVYAHSWCWVWRNLGTLTWWIDDMASDILMKCRNVASSSTGSLFFQAKSYKFAKKFPEPQKVIMGLKTSVIPMLDDGFWLVSQSIQNLRWATLLSVQMYGHTFFL